MRFFIITILAASLLIAVGCSNDKSVNTNDSALNFDVIGSDTPDSPAAALDELSAMSITVPNPVDASDETLAAEFNAEYVRDHINNPAYDEDTRMHFRRILGHLHEQLHALRRCMASNDDPQLRRLGNGAVQAIRHGLRALHAGEPRLALEYFHTANRALNAAGEICRAGDGRG